MPLLFMVCWSKNGRDPNGSNASTSMVDERIIFPNQLTDEGYKSFLGEVPLD